MEDIPKIIVSPVVSLPLSFQNNLLTDCPGGAIPDTASNGQFEKLRQITSSIDQCATLAAEASTATRRSDGYYDITINIASYHVEFNDQRVSRISRQ